MDFTKIIGWLVFLAGLIIIGWTLMSSYNIFTDEAAVPEFFEIPKEEVITQKEGTQDVQTQVQQIVEEQLKGFLPVDAIANLLNLAVWSMLAFILIFGGGQAANIGIKLIKK